MSSSDRIERLEPKLMVAGCNVEGVLGKAR